MLKSNRVQPEIKMADVIPEIPVARIAHNASIRRFTVAEWLKHSPATLEVMGSRPTFGGISEI